MLIRKPLDVYDVSGFSTYFEGSFIVCLNSSFTLGHERYTAAHELYHILYNSDLLKKERLSIRDDAFKLEDIKADVFASEFLLPEDYVKKLFFKLVNVDKYKIEARHVVRLNNTLKVSYKGMLKRLVQLGLCDISLYDELKEYGSIEKKEELQEITQLEGYDISLIIPSNVSYISKEYLEIARTNYENGKISYGKISSDNKNEFKWLEEYITLTHNNLLSLCVYFKLMSDVEAEKIFNDINSLLSRPTSMTFDVVYSKSFIRFNENDWTDYLQI